MTSFIRRSLLDGRRLPFAARLPLLGLLALTLGACADAAGTAEQTEADAIPVTPGLDDAGVTPTPDARPDDPPPPPPPGARELRIVGDVNRLVFFGADAEFTVEYVGTDADGAEVPIQNQPVAVQLLDEGGNDRTGQGVEGSVLQASNALTSGAGEATFRLRAGMRATRFQLVATAEDAPSVAWNVTVSREGAGALSVTVEYADDNRYSFRDLSNSTVYLFRDQNCDVLRAAVPGLAGADFAVDIMPFNELDNQITIEDLDDGRTYSVAATVNNLDGNVVAFGCADAARVVGGEVTEVLVDARDLPFEFKGRYTVVNRFDLTDLLETSGNSTLETVADVIEVLRIIGSNNGERGEALINLFCDLVDVGDGVCDIVSRLGARLVDEAIDQFVPPEILRVLTVISDVMAIVSEMTTVGEIEFIQSHLDQENRLIGNDNRWQRFRFIWRNNCPPGADCVREFTIGDIDENRRPIAGVFDAEMDGNELYIEGHHLTFRYGLIVLGLLETWAFPAIVGANQPVSLEELLGTLLPCQDINDFFGDPNSGLCEDVLVVALSEVVIDQIARLNFEPEQFVLEGVTVPLDENGDLIIDKLSEGVWHGMFDFGDTQLSFRGCFVGCRDMECPEADCLIPPPGE